MRLRSVLDPALWVGTKQRESGDKQVDPPGPADYEPLRTVQDVSASLLRRRLRSSLDTKALLLPTRRPIRFIARISRRGGGSAGSAERAAGDAGEMAVERLACVGGERG